MLTLIHTDMHTAKKCRAHRNTDTQTASGTYKKTDRHRQKYRPFKEKQAAARHTKSGVGRPGGHTGRQTENRHTHTDIDMQEYRHTGRQEDIQAGRQPQIHTDTQTDRQTDRQKTD